MLMLETLPHDRLSQEILDDVSDTFSVACMEEIYLLQLLSSGYLDSLEHTQPLQTNLLVMKRATKDVGETAVYEDFLVRASDAMEKERMGQLPALERQPGQDSSNVMSIWRCCLQDLGEAIRRG